MDSAGRVSLFIRIVVVICFLFNDGHVLQLSPETVRRRIRNDLDDYDGQMVSGDKFSLNFLTFVLQFREKPQQGN